MKSDIKKVIISKITIKIVKNNNEELFISEGDVVKIEFLNKDNEIIKCKSDIVRISVSNSLMCESLYIKNRFNNKHYTIPILKVINITKEEK